MPISQIEQVAVGKLRLHPSNVHNHSKKQIAQIERSIGQIGFVAPIIANENRQILAGHGRWLAAKQLRFQTVPVVTVSGLSEAHAILIEDASTGIALAQEMKGANTYPVNPIPIDRDKIGRLYVQQAKFEAGLVHFPRGARFLPELEAELLAFPQGKTDDQVDSISQALNHKLSTYTLDNIS